MIRNLQIAVGNEEMVYLSWAGQQDLQVRDRIAQLERDGFRVTVRSQYPSTTAQDTLITEYVWVRKTNTAAA
jgi:hypothetical protein